MMINAVLAVAVAVLYFLHFSDSEKNTAVPQSGSAKAVLPKMEIKQDTNLACAVIGFVNIDTLFEKYTFFKKVKDKNEASVENFKKEYKKMVETLQKDYNNYVEKAGRNEYTLAQAEQMEQDLMNRRTSIAVKEKDLGKLEDNASGEIAKVQQTLHDFFERFGREKGYSCVLTYTNTGEGALGVDHSMDVTKEAIDILNSQYAESMKKTSPKK